MKRLIIKYKWWLYVLAGAAGLVCVIFLLLSIKDKDVLPEHSVAFMVGTRFVEEQSVKDGESAEPPAELKLEDGLVFSHWDKDFVNIVEDTLIRAVCVEVGDSVNVFALQSVYCRAGEQIVMPLDLLGQVDLVGFDIRIKYDNTALRFVEFTDLDEDIVANCVAEEGMLYLNFVTNKNIQGGFKIGGLCFEALESQNDKSDIEMVFNDIARLEGEDIVEAESTLIHGTVFIY